MITLQAIIVDDEELSIKRLKRMLDESGRIEASYCFLNPVEAYDYARSNSVDVAFLDISMPDINGMKLSTMLKDLNGAIRIVFATGYEKFAVQAFDVNALDYLLKPVTSARLAQTLDKLYDGMAATNRKPQLKIRLFNGIRIYLDHHEEALKFRSPKTEELFAFLVCKRSVSREEIIDTLWPGLEPEKAMKNLNSTLYYIRKAINEMESGQYIQSTRDGISLMESNIDCDLYLFEELVKQIRIKPIASAGLLEKAEALYTGELLVGKGYDWAAVKSRLIERDFIALLETAATNYLAANEVQKALRNYQEIMKWDPIREDISFEIIKLLERLGRNNEAIKYYRGLEELLLQELGVKPDRKISEYVAGLIANA